jgi:hypothetical protein
MGDVQQFGDERFDSCFCHEQGVATRQIFVLEREKML